jgi:APA family basic amino acid/polyamine antiporter
MASNGDLPRVLDRVHPRFRVPHRAEVAVGLVVAVTVLLTDVRSAIGFSSFTVLVYYGIANASALTLRGDERRRPAWIGIAGLVGCTALAACLPLPSVAVGAGVLGLGALIHRLRRR